MRWWGAAPRPEAETFNDRIVAKEGFPYRAITQTRDLAIGGIMLDLGANIGRTAIPRVIAGDVTVAYCAEPDPLNFVCLYRNAIDNGLRGLVLPDQVAITGAAGTVRLFRAKGSGGHRVLFDDPSGAGAADEAHVIDVEGVTLDAWVARLGVDPRLITFVKVDTQGAEPHVLSGGAQLLAQRHIAWQLEISPDLLESAGSSVRDLVSRLQSAFTHYIDLNRDATGERAQPISALGDGLAYLSPHAQTDVIVYNAG
jgi:FkbM family methyltransferase